MADGRFAPSPTGPLHVGNLRTALIAWLQAKSTGGRYVVRVEDLDPVACDDRFVDEHLADLAVLGLTIDGPVIRQSDPEIRVRHEKAVEALEGDGLLYPCYCSRREVTEAAAAAHGPGPEGAYPGTCRELTDEERAQRAAARPDRDPAWRVRAGDEAVTITDLLHGEVTAIVDDFVIRRGDGVPAYNLAVVVDDAVQGIDEVVRADDLLLGTPRQAWLCDHLGLPRPRWVHVPLVIGTDGERLAKRHGSVTRIDLVSKGVTSEDLLRLLLRSIGLSGTGVTTAADAISHFSLDRIPRGPWVFDPAATAS